MDIVLINDIKRVQYDNYLSPDVKDVHKILGRNPLHPPYGN